MIRLRKMRIVIWPVAAATAIIAVLFVFEDESIRSSVLKSKRSATTSPMRRPWTLVDEEQSSRKTRMAWTGPALNLEAFSRDELTYPFPPLCEIRLESAPAAAGELIANSREKTERPQVLKAPNARNDFNQDVADELGAIAIAALEAATIGPSILTDDADTALATLHPPVIHKPATQELPNPAVLPLDPFGTMQLSSRRRELSSEQPVTDTASQTDPSNAMDASSPLEKATRQRYATQWPSTPTLRAAVEEIASLGTDLVPWSEQVHALLDDLQGLARLSSPEAGDLLLQLGQQTSDLEAMVREDQPLASQRTILAVAYALARRSELWTAVWNNLREQSLTMVAATPRAVTHRTIAELVAEIRTQLDETGDRTGWTEFLLLDHIVAAEAEKLSEDQRRLVAQRYLSRVHYTEFSDVQHEWFDKSSCRELADAIHPWVYGPVDYVELLQQIENQEESSISRQGTRIASTMQTLRFGEQGRAAEVAATINKHYRNANLRLSISNDMLRRLLPSVPEKEQPIRDRVLGADVRGKSVTRTNLDVDLIPDADAWQIRLNSRGSIDSQTWSRQGPAALKHHGEADFQAGTRIRIDRSGVEVNDPAVSVAATNRLRRMRTDYDGFPIVGPLVREYVLSRHQVSRAAARRYTESRMRAQIGTKISEALREQMDDAETTFSSRLIGPLSGLGLTPTVVDLATTEDRLTVRYRLSGDWQLAAFTPRPRAPGGCLMSMQIHQSALNNTFEQLAPKSKSVTIQDLFKGKMKIFGFDSSEAPEDLPANTLIRFTSSRPVTVEIEDGRMELTLRIVRLDQRDGVSFRNFLVRATYVPQLNGVRPMLVRDGHLNIAGPRMSLGTRVAIRTIFNKVLSPNRPVDLTTEDLRSHPSLEGLAITQFELRDGWIGFAIGPEDNFMAEAELYSSPMRR